MLIHAKQTPMAHLGCNQGLEKLQSVDAWFVFGAFEIARWRRIKQENSIMYVEGW